VVVSQINVDRRHKPHKPFTVPVEQMEMKSLYQNTFIKKDMDHLQQIIPKSQYQWPNEQHEMKSEHKDSFQEKPVLGSSGFF
jgi:hypothetical protein